MPLDFGWLRCSWTLAQAIFVLWMADQSLWGFGGAVAPRAGTGLVSQNGFEGSLLVQPATALIVKRCAFMKTAAFMSMFM